MPADLPSILAAYARPLERVAASCARSEADREDLLQDFALALFRALPSFRGECSEKTFVLRVAHNRALTFLATRGRPMADIDEHTNDVTVTTGRTRPSSTNGANAARCSSPPWRRCRSVIAAS